MCSATFGRSASLAISAGFGRVGLVKYAISMASSELIFQTPLFYTPDADSGGGSPGSASSAHEPVGASNRSEPERSEATRGKSDAGREPSQLDPERLVPFLKTEFTFPAIDTYIEARFERVGLLSILEQAGVLPQLEDPNPYDLEHETAAYEQWWAQHPDEQDVFIARLEERQLLLKYLHIGAIVGYITGRDLYSGRDFPR